MADDLLGYEANITPLQISQDMMVRAPKKKDTSVAVSPVSNSGVEKWTQIGKIVQNSVMLANTVADVEKHDQAVRLQDFKDTYTTKITNLRANIAADRAAADARGEDFNPEPYINQLYEVYKGSGGAVTPDGVMGTDNEHASYKGMNTSTRENAYRFLTSTGLGTYETLVKGKADYHKNRALFAVGDSILKTAVSTTVSGINAKKDLKSLLDTKTTEQWENLGYSQEKVVGAFFNNATKALDGVNTREELINLQAEYEGEKDNLLLDNADYLQFHGKIQAKIAAIDKANKNANKVHLTNAIKELEATPMPYEINIANTAAAMEDTSLVPKELHNAYVAKYPGMPQYVNKLEKKYVKENVVNQTIKYLETVPVQVGTIKTLDLPQEIRTAIKERIGKQLESSWKYNDMNNIVGTLIDQPEYKNSLKAPITKEISTVLSIVDPTEYEQAKSSLLNKLATLDTVTDELLTPKQRFQVNLLKRYPKEIVDDVILSVQEDYESKLKLPSLTNDEKDEMDDFLNDLPFKDRKGAKEMIMVYSNTFKDLTFDEIIKDVENGYMIKGEASNGLRYRADRQITNNFGNPDVLNKTLGELRIFSNEDTTVRMISGEVEVKNKKGITLLRMSKEEFSDLYETDKLLLNAARLSANETALLLKEGSGFVNFLANEYNKLNQEGTFDWIKGNIFNMYQGDIKKSNAYSRRRVEQFEQAKKIADDIKHQQERRKFLGP